MARNRFYLSLFVFCLALPSVFTGCRPVSRAKPRSKDTNAEAIQAADTDFEVAFDFLSNFHRFESGSVGDRITYHLQRWVETKDPDVDWIADPMIARLPKRYDSWQKNNTLSELRFDLSAFDVLLLREAIWAKDLATQIDAAKLHDTRLSAWLADNKTSLGSVASQELTTACKVFDWTIRNIQQERVPYRDAKIPEGKTKDDVAILTPADGAMYLPAEALILGKGDWIVRSRIATLIARQAGLATTMLGIDGDSEAKPWCWAVLIEGELYLFDFRLGLPIPLDKGEGIATLKQITQTPTLPRQLDLPKNEFGKKATYPVSEDDLKKVVALIDATPESLSQRMKLVERQLTGDKKLALTTAPSTLAIDLRKSAGITGARLWTVPFEIYRFRQDLNQMVAQSRFAAQQGKDFNDILVPQSMQDMTSEMRLVDGSGQQWTDNLSHGRRQHFRGIFVDTDSEDGAKTAYMDCRIPDSEINMRFDFEDLYKRGQIASLPSGDREREVANVLIDAIREGMKRAKQNASFWLGLIAFDEGKYPVAVNYLEKRTLGANPDGPWTNSATYNLARAYEEVSKDDESDEEKRAAAKKKAQELFRSLPKSTQSPGNRIRANRL